MTILTRISFAILMAASVAGAAWKIRHLRGDLITYQLKRADSNTTPAEAIYMEGEMRRGLKLHPMAPDAIIRRAGYLALLERYDASLAQLGRAREYGTGIQGFLLEAEAYQRTGHPLDAIAAYERMRRIAPLDRSIVQSLIKLYSDTRRDGELSKLVAASDTRWPGGFDQLVAQAHLLIDDSDAPLILKYFLLAANATDARRPGPQPRIFDLADVRSRILDAAELLDYRSEWADWPRGGRPNSTDGARGDR